VTDDPAPDDEAPDDEAPDYLAFDEIQVGTGRAQVLADADRPGGYLLIVDRVRQSYVDLDEPTYLDFEYIQTMADVLDSMSPPAPARLTVTHVGGGGCTLPRYVVATRPGSSQIVLEPDVALIALVRARLPLPTRSGIRIRAVDGVSGVRALPAAGADVLVLDAFLGGRVPGEFTGPGFVSDVARVLRPGGVLLANIPDGPPLAYLRRVLATLRDHFAHLLIVADTAVLRGRRFGNVVVVASRMPLPDDEVARAAAAGAFPRRTRGGAELMKWISGARPFTATDTSRSPEPPNNSWRMEF
jgi:spermidine synthase